MNSLKIRFRRLKFWWNLLIAYVARYKLRLLTLIVSILTLTIIASQIWPQFTQNNTINIGYVGSYTLETIPTQVLDLVTESLITKDESGKPIPSLASKWTISDDGKTYVVFLRDNLKWHDSTNVEAKDISIAIRGIQITALNNKAIEFKLENPISSFPLALDKPVFKKNSFYGTGPFRIVDIDQVDNLIRKISLVPKDRNLPRVNIKFYQTESQAINALKIGEIKSLEITHAQEISKLTTLDTNKDIAEEEIITVFLNTQDKLLGSKEMRQALYYAINKSEFDGEIVNSPISTANWAYEPESRRYEYNPGRAKELLAKSQVDSPKIILSAVGDLEEIAQIIKRDWETTGIATEIKIEKTVPQSFQALLAINKLSPDPDQYSTWHSTQLLTNISHYKNVKIDKLLEDARTESDPEERKKFYSEFQKDIMDDVPAIFLYHPYKYKLTYKNAKRLIEKLPK